MSVSKIPLPIFARYRHLWLVVLFAGVACLVVLSMLLGGRFPSGPDVGMHLFSAQDFADEMHQGVWYPRWLGDWYTGYGAPMGVAYSPLTYMAVGVLSFLGVGTVMAFKIIFWVSAFASGLLMYALAHQFLPTIGALAAGVFYQVAPYRIIDLYERTAFPEFVSFVWLPLILLLIVYCVQQCKLIHHLMLALAVAALFTTHLMIAYIFGLSIVAWLVVMIALDRRYRGLKLAYLAGAAGLGVLLASAYLLPAVMESQYMNTDWLSQSGNNLWGNYENNFLFSAGVYWGTEQDALYQENLAIGIASVAGIAVLLLSVIVNGLNWKNRVVEVRAISAAMTVILAISLFMSFSPSHLIWQVLPYAENIAFPWRWQTVSVLASAYLVGDMLVALSALSRAPVANKRLVWAGNGLLLAAVIVGSVGYSGLLMWRARSQVLSDDLVQQFIGEKPLDPANYIWVFDDPYLPMWSQNFDYIASPADTEHPVTGDVPLEVEIETWNSPDRHFHVAAPEPTTINVQTFWFPGWEASVNGQPSEIAIRPEDGTMLIELPSGESDVELHFQNTSIRNVGLVITCTFGLLLAGSLLYLSIGEVKRYRLMSSTMSHPM